MLTTIVFDVDGTLLNTIEDIKDSLNVALTKNNFPEVTTDETKHYLGSGVKMLVHRALRNFEHTDIDEGNVLQAYTVEYEEHKSNKTSAFFGIIDLLKELKEKGLKLAVLSNKDHNDTVELIQSFFGSDTFDMIVGKQHGIPVKPDPTSMVSIMKELHSHAEEILVVGDGETDMELAINTGCKKCGVLWGYRPYELLVQYQPDYIVNEPKDILDIVNELHYEEEEIIESPDFDDDEKQASSVMENDYYGKN